MLLVSADVYRPAAIEQLRTLAAQVASISFRRRSASSRSPSRARRSTGRAPHYHDVLIVDTAGRLAIDEAMMREIAGAARGGEAGRDAVRRRCDAGPGRGQHGAKAFRDALPLTGVVLTKLDGDARGGAALSVRHVTGAPIKFAGVAREDRRPRGVPSRADGLAHPRHGRRAVADRGGARRRRRRGGEEARRRRSRRARASTSRTTRRRSGRCARWAASRRCSTSCRRELAQAAARAPQVDERKIARDRGHHQFDDARPSARSRRSSRRRASAGSPPAPASRCRR